MLVPSALLAKSLYGSQAVYHFFGTEYEIKAGFGPIGNTENFQGAVKYTLRAFFYVFMGKRNKLKNIL